MISVSEAIRLIEEHKAVMKDHAHVVTVRFLDHILKHLREEEVVTEPVEPVRKGVQFRKKYTRKEKSE